MKRNLIWVWAVVVFAGAGVFAGEAAPVPAPAGGAAVAAEAVKAEGWSIAPLLPPETILVVSVTDAQKALTKIKQTGLWNIYNNEDIQRAFRAPLFQARIGMGLVELQMGIKIQELLDLFSRGEVTVAWIDTKKRNEQNQPIPDLLIGVQAKDKAQALIDEVNRTLDKVAAQANLRLIREQVPIGNSTITKVSLPFPGAADLAVSMVSLDGTVIFALGDGRAERMLAMREKFKVDAPKMVEGQAPDVLAQLPAFAKLREKAGENTDFSVFLDVEQLLKNPILNIQPKTEKEQRDWETAGLRSIRAISYSSGISGKGLREQIFIDSPKDKRKGLLALIDGEGLKPDALNAAPRNSIIAGAIKLTPDKLLERILDIAAVENPQVKEDANGFFMVLGQQLNLDVKRELFAALSGQGVFSVSMTAKHPKLPVAFPQALVTLGVKDVAALKNLIASIKKAAAENFEFTEMTFGLHEIVTAREKPKEGKDPGQISYVIDNNDVILALYPLALREELARRAKIQTANPEKLTLADDPDFAQARNNVSSAPHGLLYVDTGALLTAAYEMLIPIAQLRERRAEVDLLALPPADVIAQNVGGSVMGFKTDDDGIVAEGYSPGGMFTAFSVAPLVIPRIQQRLNARAGGEVGGRGFGRGRRGGDRGEQLDAQEQERRDEMAKDLHKALQNFAQDNAGKYPAKLKELEGKYFLNANVNLEEQVAYIGKQDAPNKVVAHSSERLAGPVTILLQNGDVETIPRRALGRILNQGYTPELKNQAGGPGANEAVKPPRPPEF